MPKLSILLTLFLLQAILITAQIPDFQIWGIPGATPELFKTMNRLSNPLIGDDGRIYSCSGKSFFTFESNGSVAWAIPLNHTCHRDLAPIQDETGKIYLIAEDRVLKIIPSNFGTPNPVVEDLFGPESKLGGSGEIIGISIGIWSSSLFINLKNVGLFTYMLDGNLLWSVAPVLYRSGYRQGCKNNVTTCYFASAPIVDQCEGSVYMLDNEGQLYSLSARRPDFNWIRDFSALDNLFTITPGNNGRVYLAFPRRALIKALDASTGNILWEGNVGPLSSEQCSPIVDSMGWVSIGSLDGLLYSFSPTGVLKKHLRETASDSVVQINPVPDCSGKAVYAAQLRMKSKTSITSGNYTFISVMDPVNLIFRLLVPSTGAVYWTADYPGQLSSLFLESYLRHFALDARILLAFITSAKMGNPMACHTTRQKLIWSCYQAQPKHATIYTSDERKILLFFLFQLLLLMVLAGLVRFCCIFWSKKKLQKQDLGEFLEKRHSLHSRRKACDHMITELSQRTAEESTDDEVLEILEELVREREGITRKLSTTYSLGRDEAGSKPMDLLPLYSRDKEKGKGKSYSFQRPNKESVTIFHTVSEASSIEGSGSSSGSSGEVCWDCFGDRWSAAKPKPGMGVRSQGEEDFAGPSNRVRYEDEYWEGASSESESKEFTNPLFDEHGDDSHEAQSMQQEMSTGFCLKRRALSSTY